jgi:hypothetical protein
VPPQGSQRAFRPVPEQAKPVALQVRVPPVPQQGWPAPPHDRHRLPPSVAAHTTPLAVQVLLLQQ